MFTQLKNNIKTAIWNSRSWFNVNSDATAGNCLIIIYHGVVPHNHLKFNNRFITVAHLRQQLILIKKNFNVISVADLFEGKINSDKMNVAITFDDGYKNNIKYAVPLLEELALPVSFYITTARVAGYDILWPDYLDIISKYATAPVEVEGKLFSKKNNEFRCNNISLKNSCRNAPWSYKESMMWALKPYSSVLNKPENKDYWELMTAEDIITISQNKLFTIGAHGVYHNNLASIPLSAAKEELVNSKNYLEALINKKIDELAYPDGSYNETVADLALQTGYNKQLLVSYNTNEIHHSEVTKERFGINPFLNSANQLAYFKRGKY